MAKIALLMPDGTFQRQISAAHLARLESVAGAGNVLRFAGLDALTADPAAAQVAVIVTGWGAPLLDAAAARALPALRLIAHGAGTLRTIVDPALFDLGIRATNSACANAVPVAEFTLSWILRWNKRLPQFEAAYKASTACFAARGEAPYQRIGNIGKTIGVIGASRVGRKLMQLLQSFDLDVALYDPLLAASEFPALGARRADLDAVMAADIVSVNAPLLPETRHMIGAAQLARMTDGALLINTARGGLVDHDALLAELRSGRISAVLDVTEPEPLPEGSPFLALDNCWLTPHVAGSLGTEIHRMTDSVISEIALFLSEGRLRHEVGPANWATAA
ncbi:hydroxyacid dehydrogenase [Rhodobacteraceae bacterium 2CG4]|uniref:Hydroxyacid dehydrogenase n=1 Tax=Halovulum marinum TaxID=2662447 RepID=A0A6L5YW24_9RHOB|nr:hydroxyacid dehydrogenase [Halovulum marinum]MSU88015.1 hydroxyacid dehydrogenase [Halovulum marinum]